MENIIAEEKARIQRQFHWLNERGCRLQIRERGGENFIDTITAELTVTRIAPHFDASGEIIRTDFWLLWKELGYQEGFNYSHTIKVVNVSVDDTLTAQSGGSEVNAWLIVELTDDLDRIYHLEMIEPVSEPAHAKQWDAWLAFRKNNRDLFQRIDSDILAEHIKIAEDWQ
jgi:hypothetical protein